ncbi:GIY-YIG nuclease family protein [Mycobacteroides abscessus]|uniref:GIY-YIG nuclease family protein n=1 Tax=Mycobacteroides abscessus TaxID=36809 RepID=UPI001F3F2CBE|nr:GIY-YIG nuclease family protein [Mycobacteroides abscessus]
MASTSRASTRDANAAKPKKKDLPAPIVQEFRKLFDDAKKATDEQGRKISSAKWGVYAFFDYDGEPIYVGQTHEQLSTRLNRHLTNQRTDAVAMRILDIFEVAEVRMWPVWDLQSVSAKDEDALRQLDAYEYSAYLAAIKDSKFGAILNEKIPPISEPVELPQSYTFPLISEETRRERGHSDVRIARRAETIARLAAVAHERGEVSDGLRRVLVIQAVRLAYISAVRLAEVEGRPEPDASAISVEGLVGSVLYEHSDPHGEGSDEDAEDEIGDEDPEDE